MEPSFHCMNVISLGSQGLLPHEEAVIFVVSTTGQGDTPDSMKVAFECLVSAFLLLLVS